VCGAVVALGLGVAAAGGTVGALGGTVYGAVTAESGSKIDAAETELFAGDCQLANTAIHDGTGRRPVHPLQVLARAYGLPEE